MTTNLIAIGVPKEAYNFSILPSIADNGQWNLVYRIRNTGDGIKEDKVQADRIGESYCSILSLLSTISEEQCKGMVDSKKSLISYLRSKGKVCKFMIETEPTEEKGFHEDEIHYYDSLPDDLILLLKK